jgi:hypothetical protein
MFGSTIWNAGATLRQYPYSATGVPVPAHGPISPARVAKKYFQKGLKSRHILP